VVTDVARIEAFVSVAGLVGAATSGPASAGACVRGQGGARPAAYKPFDRPLIADKMLRRLTLARPAALAPRGAAAGWAVFAGRSRASIAALSREM
jgi:hypothetical protein